ncbi:MAG: glutamate racemase [Fusobacteriia bacterium 4572_74]|nr:MAG: glutamate racemase [Fusobacteriia bacterium 4572_74]
MYKIGIFDSGVGGLTVLKEIKKATPTSSIIYYGDNGNAPYGDKQEEVIRTLCLKIGKFLYEKQVDVIVIACNTATAAALKTLRATFPIPIIGVIEPGVRAALEVSENKNIGVILTPASAKMNAYKKVFDKIAPEGYTIMERGCKLICPMVEGNWEVEYGTYMTDELIKLYLEGIPSNVDTLVLGCTHYPIMQDTISKYFTKNIVNPANETANELMKQLAQIKEKDLSTGEPTTEYIVSGNTEKFFDFAKNFIDKDIKEVKKINL